MDRASGRWSVWLFVGALLCSCALAATVGAVSPVGPAASAEQPAAEGGLGDLSAEAFEADRTRFLITIYGNGSGKWAFRYEQRLDDPNATTEFEAYAERFNQEETNSYTNFRTRVVSLTESGNSTTGRNMTAERFRRDARVEERPPSGNEFGVVEMSFVWTDFAEPDGDRLVVGDVFVGGLYIGPEQQLRFDRGPGVRFESVDPAPDSIAAGTLGESESVTWLGERQFTDRRPRVVYVPRNDEPETGAGPGPAASTDSGASSGTSPGLRSPVSLLVAVFVILLGAGGAVAYRSRNRQGPAEPPTDGSADASGETAEGTTAPAEQPASEAPGTETESAETAGIRTTEGADSGVAPAVSEDELRSDEELVVDLLEDHGGRMKQVDIVDGTEWSKSKVSMLLSEMDDDGRISKLRVGRENIVSLAGHEPDAAGSPFDDED
jgi:uncharacterized membrane protein